MKRALLLILITAACFNGMAQSDTIIVKSDTLKVGDMVIVADTIKMGNMIIVNQRGGKYSHKNNEDSGEVNVVHISKQHRENSTSRDLVLDLGFANFDDHTNYANATAQNYLVNKPGTTLGAADFKLKQVKSSNVNLWFFMKRMNLINHYVNLKFGFGLDMNNYRFEKPVSFKQAGTNPFNAGQKIDHSFAIMDSISFKKDKLSADYITIPLMINFQSNPNYSERGISASFGISAGYLYSSRNKQVSDQRGKLHNKGDYDLQKFKIQYIGELGLGKLRLYGSYSPKSIFSNGLDIRPYTLGIRFSRW